MKMKTEKDEQKPIVILGVAISPVSKPRLYRRAKNNPGWVEAAVEGMMRAQGFTNPGSAMAILDSDL